MSLLPHNFAQDFQCLDASEEKTIFVQVINSKLVQKPEVSLNLEALKGKKPRLLIELLLNSNTPIRKEILIEKIWGEEYRPKFDARFYKLVERVKGMVPMPIKNDNSAYYIARAS